MYYNPTISTAETKKQLQQTEDALRELTGKSSKPLFRPPYGDYNASVLQRVGDAGYSHTIMWTIDTIDWRGDSSQTIIQRVTSKVRPGAIILMHTGAGASGTLKALTSIINNLKAKGYRFVTVSQLLKLETKQTGEKYIVRTADTLYGISKRYKISVQQLAQANNIKNLNLIIVGQSLIIPGQSTGENGNSSTPINNTQYIVKSGDTLYSIAKRYNTSVKQIAQVNRIKNINLIRLGQPLIIPGKSAAGIPSPNKKQYTVKAADTLYAISRYYNISVLELAKLNKLTNPNLIRVGQTLMIP